MKKAMIAVLVGILIISMASVAMASGPKQNAAQNSNGPAAGDGLCGDGLCEDCENPLGPMAREMVQERIQECTADPENCPCEGEGPEDMDDPEGGMPFQHRVSGREFGQMVREMAHSEPGAVARHMHQWRFNLPTLE